MKKQEIINLNLRKIYFPIHAIFSIIHRLSGLILFFFIGIILYLLNFSVSSNENFEKIIYIFRNNIKIKILLLLFIINAIYHFINGIRHIMIDLGLFNLNLKTNEIVSIFMFLIFVLLSLICGILIC